MPFNISLLGDKALERSLAGMTEKLERRVLAGTFRTMASAVRRVAQANIALRVVTPSTLGRGKRVRARNLRLAYRIALRFARLRNALKVQALRRKKGRVGSLVRTPTREELGITGRYYYPAHLEAGHGPPGGHRVRARGTGRRTPPHPYLRPALKGHEGVYKTKLVAEIRVGIERELRRP